MHTGKFRKLEEGQFCILPLSRYLTPTEAAVSPILLRPFAVHAGWGDGVTPPAPPLSASPRGLGRCHAPYSAPLAVHGQGRRCLSYAAPPLSASPRGLGRCHAHCSAPLPSTDWGQWERRGKDSLWFLYRVVQVQTNFTFTMKNSRLTKTGGRTIVL